MASQWKCARCSAKNDEGTLTCQNCRMIRGAVVVPGSFSPPPGQAPDTLPDEPSAPPVSWDTAADRHSLSEAAAPTMSSWNVGVEPSDKPVRVPLWRRIPIGAVIVVAILAAGAIGGVIFNASRSSTGEISRRGDMMATDLRVGDCFDLKDPAADEITDVTALPCEEEHEFELIYTGSMPSGDYPREDAFDAFVEDNCVPAFDVYIGMAYADSKLDIHWLIPLESGWNAGDRSIQCSAYHPRVHRLTGSLKGSSQ